MSSRWRWREIRSGFAPAFWVANGTEIFERIAYYATSAVLAIFLNEELHFSSQVTGWLMGISGFVVFSLPILAGALADRFGFRRSLLFAFVLLTVGYFLLGSVTAPWMEPLRKVLGDKWLLLTILLIPALGPGMVKPCVAGTVAQTSGEEIRSLGYSIYYMLVNVGGALGPLAAWLVRKRLGLGIESVFRAAAACVFLMFWATLLFYREPRRPEERKVASVREAVENIFVVLGNLRFVSFLLISSGFYVSFWQIWISAPLFIRRYVEPGADTDRLLSIEGVTIILFQVLVAYLTRRKAAIRVIALGFLISALSFAILAVHPRVWTFAVMMVVMALGEITQASRYYEYCSLLAPPGREGVYMGYAFLPIAIGYLIAGLLGGYLLREFGSVLHRPAAMWWVIVAVGILTAALMWLYGQMARPAGSRATTE